MVNTMVKESITTQLYTLDELAELLGVRANNMSEWLAFHPEIRPITKNHIPYYPISESIINEILGRKVISKIVPEASTNSTSHFIIEQAKTQIAYLPPSFQIPQLPKAEPYTKEAKENESRLIESVGKNVKILESIYQNYLEFSILLAYMNMPIDAIVRCNFWYLKYEKEREELRKNATETVKKKLTELIRQRAHQVDQNIVYEWARTKQPSEEFQKICLQSYDFGESVARILAAQSSSYIINEIRDGLETKLEIVCSIITTKDFLVQL